MTKSVLFVCGSPRRGRSSSLIVGRYLARFLDHDYEFVDVGRAKLTDDPNEADQGFVEVVEKMGAADAIVWTFGTWGWFVPPALHRLFDKLVTQEGHSFEGKLAAAVITSGGVGDDYSLERVRFMSEQLGLASIGGVSVLGSPFMGIMGDEEVTEASLRVLAGRINRALDDGYRPAKAHEQVDRKLLSSAHRGWGFTVLSPPRPEGEESTTGSDDKTIVAICAFGLEDDPAARSVVDSLRACSRNTVEVVELEKLDVKPCVGCYLCGSRPEGICVLKDEYAALRDRLDQADGLVYIATTATGLIEPRLKAFLDRNWDLIHRPAYQDKHGFVVAAGGGPLDAAAAWYVQYVTSKMGTRCIAALAQGGAPEDEFAATVQRAVEDLDRAMEEGWQVEERFEVRATRWAFRDLAAEVGMVMKADYNYHRDQGLFDAPSPGGMNAVLRLLFANKKIQKAMLKRARGGRDGARESRLEAYVAAGGELGKGKEIGAAEQPSD